MTVQADKLLFSMQTRSVFWIVFFAAGCAVLGGCQRRAYTDLYVERMAGEIRELEDRIYEYDAAYRAAEDELAIKQAENENLQNRLLAAERKSIFGQNKPDGSKASPNTTNDSNKPTPKTNRSESNRPEQKDSTIIPTPDPNADIDLQMPGPLPKKSLIPTAPENNSRTTMPPADSRSMPKSGSGGIKAIDPNELEPPDIQLGSPSPVQNVVPPANNKLDSTIPALPGFSAPPKIPNSSDSIPGNTLPRPQGTPPPFNSVPGNGAPANPPKPVMPPSANNRKALQKDTLVVASSYEQPTSEKELSALPRSTSEKDLKSTQIVIPGLVQQATFEKQLPADVKPAQPQDSKVVEIDFHPTLCRGLDDDEVPGDDGIYLVLQTQNSAGEFVTSKGKLTVVVIDPQRIKDPTMLEQARIARWQWSSVQLKDLIEPIGVSQGIHLSLGLSANKPLGDTVHVHVRFEQEDGRKIVNQREIRLHNPSVAAGTWTARVPQR